MKLIVELTNVNQIKRFSKFKNVKYLLINYKGLSLNYSNSFEDDELNNIKELAQKVKLGLVLNAERLFSDDDLHVVKELILKKFFDQFDYITYSDFGFKQLLSEEGYQEKLIFRAPTYLTNHQDVNLYNDFLLLHTSQIPDFEKAHPKSSTLLLHNSFKLLYTFSLKYL